ncbi:GNAT family N-acetyltransferase [Acuticoccus kandeliae]|uniref:GNAT family N-acetyltransferase n=1 Tax=Acuticoccus kandeliae TaxID=2073160 RepID=UPI000D3EA287|nr:GNAT family N-acetyltransferase [Acuticoccus kandeliae]
MGPGTDGMPRPVLATARLDLTPPARADAAAIVRLVGDLEVSRWLLRVPHPYEHADAVFYLERVAPTECAVALRRREDGAFLGIMSLTPNGPGAWELGYWIGRPFWGAGYASEAARRLVPFGFEALDADRLTAGYFAGNARSAGVLEKLGFVAAGRSRCVPVATGDEIEKIDLALPRARWEARPVRG